MENKILQWGNYRIPRRGEFIWERSKANQIFLEFCGKDSFVEKIDTLKKIESNI
jgi:hypothetical protein